MWRAEPNTVVVDLLFHGQDRGLICATRVRRAWAMSLP